MSLKKYKNVYFIGIGGIGISALANILFEKGHTIKGSELIKSKITENLEKKGVKIKYEQTKENIEKLKSSLIIYTTAIDENHPEIKQAIKQGFITMSYPKALGEFAKDYTLIAISGTHGKSTITAMISKIFIEANLDPTIVIGTKTKELNGENFRVGNSKYLIIEACEYKESFLNFHPNYLIINNIEADHLDYFKNEENYFETFNKFLKNLKTGGTLIISENDLKKIKTPNNINIEYWKKEKKLKLKIPGKFNQENATSAYILAKSFNINENQIIKSLENFEGSWRRMEIKKTKFKNKIFIDDYAHHPTEIKVTLKAIKEKYSKKKTICIFQPHQYNRTKHFLKEFAKSFKDTDLVIIPGIYKVRDNDEDIKEVNGEKLAQEINKISKNAIFIDGIENSAEYIKNNIKKFEIVVTMGAGNITEIYKYFS